ncbi:amino acid adenylation domain-containing protein [Salinarimonas sp.]|uniref:non-ribosomal peptide synthetase n=1 Tax=Salinarimonas sp. TaxID=2766526 RepID=UPI0032D977F7
MPQKPRVVDVLPLTALQEGILLQCNLTSRKETYCSQIVTPVPDDGRPEIWRDVFDALVARHEALRSAFHWRRVSRPVQTILSDARVPFSFRDLSDLPPPEAERAARAAFREHLQEGFDLTEPPLVKLRAVRVQPGRLLLGLMSHHLAVDGWSTDVLTAEAAEAFRCLSEGRPIRFSAAPPPLLRATLPLRPPPTEAARNLARHLEGLDLPTPFPLPMRAHAEPGEKRHVRRRLQGPALETLRAFCRARGVTLATLVNGVWGLTLARFGFTSSSVHGVVTAGRQPGAEADRLVGMYVSSLPLRIDVEQNRGVADWLRQLQRTFARMREWDGVGLADIRRAIGGHARGELFQTIVVVQNQRRSERGGEGADWLRDGFDSEDTHYPLVLTVTPGEVLSLRLVYDAQRLAEPDVDDLLAAFTALLGEAAARPEAPVGSLAVMPERERRRVVEAFNATRDETIETAVRVDDLVLAQARRSPAATAVRCGTRSLAYAELEEAAQALAVRLSRAGVGRGAVVGVCLERCLELPAALLGILRAGAAYLPLDPELPPERLRFMARDAGCAAVVTTRALSGTAPEEAARLLLDEPESDPRAPRPADAGGGPLDPAYVIYTSGSTGRPKGVVVPHAGLANYLAWACRSYLEGAPHRAEGALLHGAFAFDMAVTSLFLPLLAGRTLSILPAGAALARLEDAAGPQGWPALLKLTPSHLAALAAHPEASDGTGPEILVVGGEALPAATVRQALARFPRARLVNEYGPTETVVGCAVFEARADAEDPVPIGRPIANMRLYVLDAGGEPCPVGVVGELHIAGVGLAQGYLGRPGQTAERFLPDPFGPPGGRLYRTGDLARWRRDGALDYLGRNDDQVKIRGHRIELGEVEAALAAAPGVRAAAVAARPDPAGATRLVGYLVGETGAAALDRDAVRDHLRTRLPPAMIPPILHPVDALPLTPNGKLDRNALPEPDDEPTHGAAAFEPPLGPVEDTLAAIWRDILQTDRIGRHDDFFARGGHSLLAMRLAAAITRVLDADLPLAALFEAPTLADLAERVAAARGAERLAPILPRPSRDPAPLSFAQERLWFLEQLSGAGGAYNVPLALRLEGALDRAALRGAMTALAQRHEILRTRYREGGGRPVQIVDPQAAIPLVEHDLRSLDEPARERARIDAMRREAETPFDLTAGLPARAALLRLDEQDHVLLVTLHHVASDAWSLNVLVREFGAIYTALARGEPATLPALPIQYADYALWQRERLDGPTLQRQLAWWTQRLQNAPGLTLPTDRPHPPRFDPTGARLAFTLPEPATRALKRLAHEEGATLFMALLSGLSVLLGRHAGQEDVVIGSPVANRSRPETAGLIGPLLNTLALRTRFSGRTSFRDLLRRVRRETLDAYANMDLPFEQLVEALAPERRTDRHPVFQAMLSLEQPSETQALPGLRSRFLAQPRITTKFDLTLFVTDAGTQLTGRLEYATALFDRETVERLSEGLTALLGEAAARPEAPVGSLAVMPEQERRRVVATFNATRDETIETAVRVDDLVLAQARRSPAATAVRCGTRSLAYAELEEAAQALAVRLSRAGVGRGAVVGVCLERCLELPAALLGILRAGAAYLPLDPELPPERLRFMARDAGCAAVVTTRALSGTAPEEGARLLLDEPESDPRAPRPADAGGGPLDPAYVIYTSGSTGRPKGVVVPHAGVVNRLVWMQRQYGLGPHDRVLQKTPLGFDVSVWELFAPLIAGAELVMARPGGHRDPGYLAEEIARSGVTVLHFVPSMLRQYAATAPARDGVRLVVASGEALGADQPAAAARCFPNAAVHNLYGPTEASIEVSWWACDPAATDPVPIGRPIANMRLYVLDAGGEPCPVGVVGELHIAGVGLAQGYLGRPGQTAERFLPDPFGPPGGRLYRTGDLARWRRDGALDYLGRNDDQVKIRGHRIELGEVEAALAAAPGVRAAAVAARPDPAGATRLVGYLVGETGAAALDRDAVRDHLRTRLPPAMIPPILHPVDALPLTPNGKLDRNALPEPDDEPTHGAAACEPPLGPVEDTLAAIWRDILQTDRIGRHDDFFARGGHSLLAMRLAAAITRVLDADLPLAALFEAPTLAGLAERVAAARGAERLAPILPRPSRDPAPLSFAQERLWFLEQLSGAGGAYNVPLALRLEGALDRAALRGAMTALAQRHEILRTRYREGGGRPVQIVDPQAAIPLVEHDLRSLDEPARERARIDAMRREAETPFDLTAGLPARAALLRLDEQDHVLLVTLHHVASDAWSLNVLVREFGAIYTALARGEPATLPALPIQYADYALWQRERLDGPTLQRQLAWWTQRLQNAPGLTLPTDRPHPPRFDPTGARLAFTLPEPATRALKRLAHEEGATLFMALLSGLSVLLGRHAGQEDVVIGSPVANRSRPETAGLIGPLLNTLALRTRFSGRTSFRDLLRRVRRETLDAYANMDLPFEQLVEALAPERRTDRHPVFQAMLSLEQPSETQALPGLRSRFLAQPRITTKFDLTLFVTDAGTQLTGRLEYATALFDRETVERLSEGLTALLGEAAARPEAPVGSLAVMPERERRRVVATFNATRDETIETAVRVDDLVLAQARRSPAATAVRCGTRSLAYAELEEAAQALAVRLSRAGVGRGAVVGVCLERCLELPAALLGILRAGAAYLPLDPELPPERLRFMARDAGCAAVVTTRALSGTAPEEAARLLLDEPESDPRAPRPADAGGGPLDPAYVIYTSGSTGRPKGVVVPHAGLANYLAWACRSYLEGAPHRAEGALLHGAFAFDMAVTSLFLPLLAGRTLSILPAGAALARLEDAAGPQGWPALLKLTPSHLAALAAHPAASDGTGPEILVVGGEALPAATVRQALARFPRARLVNEYGPTETVVGCAVFEARADAEDPVPIGRPIANMRLYVLDAGGEPCPVGVVGELHIAGVGLAQGYLGRPGQTAERFLPDPFGPPGGRLYRTGDLARWRRDGALDYLGRNDDQVKIRGHRIELGEVEAALAAAPGVRAAAVAARPDPAGATRLVGYLVGETGAAALDRDAVRDHLRTRLPPAMIPPILHPVDALPLTPNGKLDRNALPEPDDEPTHGAAAFEPPLGPVEDTLAAIWRDILQTDRIGRHDDFFARGGHSLILIAISRRVREAFGVDLTIRSIYENPTIATLAALVGGEARPPAGSARLVSHAGARPTRHVFCLPPMSGTPHAYAHLAEKLGPDTALHCFRALGLDEGTVPHGSVDDLVDDYVDLMRSVQPDGPYTLIGWSFGAAVAHAVAARLLSTGRIVDGLFLLDPPSLGDISIDRRQLRRDFDTVVARHRSVLYGSGGELVLGDALDRHFLVYAANLEILRTLSPERLDTDAFVFTASGTARSERNRALLRECAARVEMVEVMCDHFTMLTSPALDVVARAIRRRLDL